MFRFQGAVVGTCETVPSEYEVRGAEHDCKHSRDHRGCLIGGKFLEEIDDLTEAVVGQPFGLL